MGETSLTVCGMIDFVFRRNSMSFFMRRGNIFTVFFCDVNLNDFETSFM